MQDNLPAPILEANNRDMVGPIPHALSLEEALDLVRARHPRARMKTVRFERGENLWIGVPYTDNEERRIILAELTRANVMTLTGYNKINIRQCQDGSMIAEIICRHFIANTLTQLKSNLQERGLRPLGYYTPPKDDNGWKHKLGAALQKVFQGRDKPHVMAVAVVMFALAIPNGTRRRLKHGEPLPF